MIQALISNSKNDEYYTPEYAIKPILKYIDSSKTIWCPFDTEDSLYVKLFKQNGNNVIATHIDNGIDFLNCEIPKCDYIISNPPYSKKTEVFDRLFGLKIPFAMLVGFTGVFESQERFELYKNNNFEILIFNKRISFFKNYSESKPTANPSFSSVYICQNILPQQIVFDYIIK